MSRLSHAQLLFSNPSQKNDALGSWHNSAIIYYGGFVSTSGGAYTHALVLNDALMHAGYKVRIISLDSLPFPFRYFPHLMLKLGNLIAPPAGFLVKGKTISLLYKLFFPPQAHDIVFFEDVYLASNVNRPSATILHALWSDNLQGMRFSLASIRRLKSAEVEILHSLTHPVVTVSLEYRNYLLNTHLAGHIAPSLECVPLGVDLTLSKRFRIDNNLRNPHALVFCGACIERKNLFFLLDVLQCLVSHDERFSLTIIGDGPLLSQLKISAYCRSLPVTFLGRLAGDLLFEQISMHSVCVHPSFKESFSFALLEAKLLGLSTIAHAGLEVPREFVDVSVSSYSVKDWCSGVLKALYTRTDPDLSAFSSELMARRLLDLSRHVY